MCIRDRGEGEVGGMAADKKINHLTGKVAQYYGLEESDIQIQWTAATTITIIAAMLTQKPGFL